MKKFADIPPFWTLGTVLASWLLAGLFPIVTVQLTVLRLLGPILIALAVLMIVWSGFWFRRKWTSIEPRHTPTALIVEGPYRISRNPIYLAMVVLATGFAVWLGALTAFLPVIGLAIALHRRFVMPEEAVLLATFEAEAQNYVKNTKRWI